MLLALHNLYPSLRPYTQLFFELSYHDPASNTYVPGWGDVCFVISATLALTAIRAIVIEWVIQPLGRSMGLKRKAALRLAEQGWQVLYYGFIWAIGLVCCCLRISAVIFALGG
jgi:acyl-CoA-dependent ceramide synthase